MQIHNSYSQISYRSSIIPNKYFSQAFNYAYSRKDKDFEAATEKIRDDGKHDTLKLVQKGDVLNLTVNDEVVDSRDVCGNYIGDAGVELIKNYAKGIE